MCESVRQKLGHTKIHFWGYRKEQDTALLKGKRKHGQVVAIYHKKHMKPKSFWSYIWSAHTIIHRTSNEKTKFQPFVKSTPFKFSYDFTCSCYRSRSVIYVCFSNAISLRVLMHKFLYVHSTWVGKISVFPSYCLS